MAPRPIFDDLYEHLVQTQRTPNVGLRVRHIFHHVSSGLQLLGIDRSGRAVCFDPSRSAIYATPVSETGVHAIDRYVYDLHVQEAGEWIRSHHETLAWVHPRFRSYCQ